MNEDLPDQHDPLFEQQTRQRVNNSTHTQQRKQIDQRRGRRSWLKVHYISPSINKSSIHSSSISLTHRHISKRNVEFFFFKIKRIQCLSHAAKKWFRRKYTHCFLTGHTIQRIFSFDLFHGFFWIGHNGSCDRMKSGRVSESMNECISSHALMLPTSITYWFVHSFNPSINISINQLTFQSTN